MAKSLKNMMGAGIGAGTATLINGTVADGLTATGSGQADALILTNDVNVIGTVPVGSGVRLLANPQPGDETLITNLGANALAVYPPLGATISGGPVNLPFSLPSGAAAEFIARTGSANWVALASGGTIPTPAVTFDTRFGTATDATTGLITFGLKLGCRRVWCNSTAADDTGDGLSAATAKKTFEAAAQVRNIGYTAGDQLMVAGTGGRTYTDDGTKAIFAFSGDSLTYPSAVLSYDPADAANSAKYGKLFGADRPRIQHAYDAAPSGASSFSPLTVGTNYIAVQGLEFIGEWLTPGADGLTSVVGHTGKHTGIAYQNTLWNQCSLQFDMDETPTTANWGSAIHVSKSGGYGQWRINGNNNWLFISGVDGVVVEDCVGAHNGWKMGATRDDALTAGGAHYLGHGIYLAAENSNVTMRRIIGMDPAQDMFSFRGPFNASCLVSIDAGLVLTFCGYSGAYTEAPNGTLGILNDMTVMGGSLISTADSGGGAFGARNCIVPSIANNIALFDNPLKGTGGDILWAGANDNPGITVSVAVSNMRSYNYSTTFEGPNSGTNSGAISLSYANCQTDIIAPRGTGNTTWSGAPTGYKTRDQIISQILTDAGLTPAGTATTRKNQLANYVIEYPHLAGQFALALDTYGLQNLGLSPITHSAAAAPSCAALTAPRAVYPASGGIGPAAFSPTTLPGIVWDLENIPASVLNTGTTPATDLQTAVKWNSQTGGLNVNDAGNGTTFQPVWHANSGANGWLHSANAGLFSTVAFGGTDASGSFYLATMVNFDSVAANKIALTLFDLTTGDAIGQIQVLSGGQLRALIFDSSFATHVANGATITASTWHAVVISVNGSAGTIDIWVDGTIGTQGTGLSSPLISTTNSRLDIPDAAFSNALSHKAALHGTGTISSGNAVSLCTYMAAL